MFFLQMFTISVNFFLTKSPEKLPEKPRKFAEAHGLQGLRQRLRLLHRLRRGVRRRHRLRRRPGLRRGVAVAARRRRRALRGADRVPGRWRWRWRVGLEVPGEDLAESRGKSWKIPWERPGNDRIGIYDAIFGRR